MITAARAAIEQDLQYFGNFLLNLLSLTPLHPQKVGRARHVDIQKSAPHQEIRSLRRHVLGELGQALGGGVELRVAQRLAALADDGGGVRQQAFRTILKNRTFHGGILAPGSSLIKHGENGKGLQSRWYAKTLATRIQAIGQVRDRFTFICGDGIGVINDLAELQHAVFFIDPPYTAGGKNGKRAGTRLYTHHQVDHERLFAAAEKVAGDVLLTYDDAPDVQALADRHHFAVATAAMKNTHHEKMSELLIGRSLDWFI